MLRRVRVLITVAAVALAVTAPAARQALANIRASLEAIGDSMRNVVKCTVMLADIAQWAAFNEIYVTFFSAPYPARSAMGVNGLALGASVEIECLAAVGR
jgi:enamine deaminase RidA (YjgF/YER057c/UK114 family)